MEGVNSGLKFNRVPKASVAIASVLATWFDQIIRARRLVSNIRGEYVFTVLRTQFEYNTGNRSASKTLRRALEDYGYRLRIDRTEIIVTKFR